MAETLKSVIIGMGIGQLYKSVLTSLGASVFTVDIAPGKAQYTSVQELIKHNPDIKFDTAHVCVPNFLHAEVAAEIAKHSKIVFVEKPGCVNSNDWQALVTSNPATRFMMVKNNMWRENIGELTAQMQKSPTINLSWINENRVPSPGSWFTTKDKAFGGVSRDLVPHLLSFVAAAFPNYKDAKVRSNGKARNWTLEELAKEGTDYGTVNPDGTYDVDDWATLSFELNGKRITITADWKSGTEDNRSIQCTDFVYEFGLCPESAYKEMIRIAVENVNNNEFWSEQFDVDMWIHNMVGEM